MANADIVRQFAQKLLATYTGAVMTQLIDIGYRTGLFEASKAGAATSEELSERAGLHERYVREWLGAMTTNGIYDYDAPSQRYSLPEEHAALLTGDSSRNLGPMSRIITHLGGHVPTLSERFHDGDGIPYSAYRPEFTHCLDDVWRRIYDEQLVDGFIGSLEGMSDALKQGIRVLDIGCGTGRALNVLAQAYPRSTFVGYDIADDAIAIAQAEAEELGLPNATFAVMDVNHFPTEPPFELIMAFDAIHDLAAPDTALRRIKDALSPEGVFLMIEFKFQSDVAGNIGNPFAPMYYGFSLLHCTPVSLASGGPGLGAVWGEQTAKQMLAEAGFTRVHVHDSPRPQNSIFACRR